MSKNQQQKDWYKKTLEKIDNIMSSDKDIADKYLEIYKYTRIALDGEPTTADKYNDEELSPKNTVRISDVNKEIAREWNRDREERINKEKSK